jgi:hypothetical protein
MTCQSGDHVYDRPSTSIPVPREGSCDLTMPSGSTQILFLAPLAGLWPHATVLIRLCDPPEALLALQFPRRGRRVILAARADGWLGTAAWA